MLNTIKWQRDPVPFLEDASRRHGSVWMLRVLGGTTFVVVSDPALIEQMFTEDPAVLHGGEAKLMVGKTLLGGHSLLLIDGPEHTQLRKLMLPAFHGDRVERFRALMERECAEDLARWPLHEPISLLPRLQEITLNVIMRAVFGVREGADEDRLRARIHDLHAYAANPLKMVRLFVANTRGDRPPKSFAQVRAALDEVIHAEIERARTDERVDERDDVLALLVQARDEDGNPLTDEQLRDQMMTLLVQGHSSTAVALAWALERLLLNPPVLERLRAELRENGDEYLEAVVKETLRARPSIPMTTRLVKQPYRLGGHDIEPGVTLVADIFTIHHREDLYPEPEAFRPERFLGQKEGKYTWIPFGGGTRYCIGRTFATTEMKAVLRTIVLQARLRLAEQGEEQIFRRATAFSPKRGVMAVLEERVQAPETAGVAT